MKSESKVVDMPQVGQSRQSFQDLKVWNKAMDLTVAIYRLSQAFPREKAFSLTSQLRRSAISIPGNIAEGHGRLNLCEFRSFLFIARGSCRELQTQLELSAKRGFGDPKLSVAAKGLSVEVENMLYSLLSKLKTDTS